MENSVNDAAVSASQANRKLHLTSFDSAQDRSPDHGLDSSWFVEKEEDELPGYLFSDTCFVASK